MAKTTTKDFIDFDREISKKLEDIRRCENVISEFSQKKKEFQNGIQTMKKEKIRQKIDSYSEKEKEFLLKMIPCHCKRIKDWKDEIFSMKDVSDTQSIITGTYCNHCALEYIFNHPDCGIDFELDVSFDYSGHNGFYEEDS